MKLNPGIRCVIDGREGVIVEVREDGLVMVQFNGSDAPGEVDLKDGELTLEADFIHPADEGKVH